MSWFNKMFSLFLGDDEDNEKQKKHIDEFEADSSSEDEEMPQITDAKVVYEYPKGKFRFPVIPDQNTRPREKDDSREQRTRRPASRYSASQPKPGNSYHYEEKAAAKKPFRPSVIPSPVYGFHEQKRAKPENHTYRAKKQTEARVTLFNEEIEKEQKSAEHKRPVREEASVQTEKNGRPLIKSESRNPALRAEFEDVPQASTEIPKETEIRPERMTEGAGLAEEKAARNEAVEETASASQNITEEDAIPAEQTPEQIEKLLDKIEETGEEMVLAEDAEAATEEQGKTYGSGKTHPDPEASVPEEPHTHGRASEITVQSDESSHRTDSNTPADALEETSGSRQTGWRQEQASCLPETAPSAGEPESRQENRETTRINEDRPEAPRKREAGAAPGSKKGSVPFNVMMFASDKQKEKAPQGYQFPNMSLLDVPPAQKQDDQDWIHEQAGSCWTSRLRTSMLKQMSFMSPKGLL